MAKKNEKANLQRNIIYDNTTKQKNRHSDNNNNNNNQKKKERIRKGKKRRNIEAKKDFNAFICIYIYIAYFFICRNLLSHGSVIMYAQKVKW